MDNKDMKTKTIKTSDFNHEYGDCGWGRMMEIKEQVANGTYVAPELPKTEQCRFLDPITILTWNSNKES